MEDCSSYSYMSPCIHVCIHTLLSSSQLQGLEDSDILLEHGWSCRTPNHNRPETGGVNGFPRPFSKSLLSNVLVEYAVLSSAYILATAPVYDPTELSRANRVATVQRTLSRPDPDLATLSKQLMCMHHGAIWCLDTHQ